MSPKHPCFPLLLPLLLLCFSISVSPAEVEPLLKLKSSLTPLNPSVLSTWTPPNNVCNFTGISCNEAGKVSEIDLSKQGLSGTLPFDAICSLTSLQKLSLGFNSLTGEISPYLRNCTQLQYLDLGNNQFSGSFPDISPLENLQFLYLNSSGFTGTFPWNSLSNMSSLTELSLGDNPFDITKFPMKVTEFKGLNWLYLSNCSIYGSIPPEIGNLSELIDLELANNFLYGSIPNEISKLNKLWQLELYSNLLTGELPFGFRNLTRLERLDASNNTISGDLSELKYMDQLVWIQLYKNNFSGQVPAEFGEFRKLVNLSLYSNHLTGELPQKLGSWAEFNFIDVSMNSLSGRIPPDMCKKGTMKKLLILQNKFSGEIPASYANCKTLIRFRVNKNSLTGIVPAGIWGLPNLNIIDIADNKFRGSITTDIAKAKNLKQIYASNNELSGIIPVEIGGASSLLWIDLSENQFTGVVPESIGKLKMLNNLYLQKNQLSGYIPASIGECLRLDNVNLAQNTFSGAIPMSLGSLPTLNSLNLSYNKFTGSIPNTLSSLKLSLLDLSNNELSGPIPKSLSIEAFEGSFKGNDGLCSSDLENVRSCSLRSRDYQAFVICLVLGLVILVILSGYYMYTKFGSIGKDLDRAFSLKDDYSWNMKQYHVLTFTEEEILDSIKPKNLIGKGGCGSVYKVSTKDGWMLAVKHIWNSDFLDNGTKNRSSIPMLDSRRGSSRKRKEFEMEVQTLSSIRHINVVKLYCSITSEDSSLLVYEYLPNGSLWDILHNSSKKLGLDWQIRYEIALGAAKGLAYLHHGYERPIIHRDVKSSNILLDEYLKPRIADFGLAKVVQGDSNRDSTQLIAGTHGYIAPEYGYTYKVSEKSDVYSFGVVLMELVTGKKPIEPEFGEGKDIVSWISSKLNKETPWIILDSSINEPFQEEAIKVLKIAINCTDKIPERRPTMKTVVQILEDAEPCKLVSVIVDKDGMITESGKEKY